MRLSSNLKRTFHQTSFDLLPSEMMETFVRKSGHISARIIHVFLGFLAGLIFSKTLTSQSFDFKSWDQGKTNDVICAPAGASAVDGQISLVELAEKHKPSKFRLSHTLYQRFYPTFFETYRKQNLKMLEIGIDTGAGSLLWREYFPQVDLWGMDINAKTLETPGGKSINMIIGSQQDRTFLEKEFMQKTGGEFDIIIDDGGHHFEQQSLSYEILFDKALKPGGYYIIEDIETSYWQKGSKLYGQEISRGGCGEANTMLKKLQSLVEVVNKKFIDNDLRVFGDVDHWVKSITFGSNIVIMQKKDHLDCSSETLYTWPDKLSEDCNAREQSSASKYPPEKFVLNSFCNQK